MWFPITHRIKSRMLARAYKSYRLQPRPSYHPHWYLPCLHKLQSIAHLSVLQTNHTHPYLRAFAKAVPSTWGALSWSSNAWLLCHVSLSLNTTSSERWAALYIASPDCGGFILFTSLLSVLRQCMSYPDPCNAVWHTAGAP